MGFITRLILLTCIALFIAINYINKPNLPENVPFIPIFFSPIERALLYDDPATYDKIGKLILTYGEQGVEHPSTLPPEGKALWNEIQQQPYWQGIYAVIAKKGFSGFLRDGFAGYPLFERIKAGEWWRVITPCFLHADLLHIFFNMLWLIVLGKQMENRLNPLAYVLFIVIVGVVSNTAQYLMSGPNFIGFSGVLTGMLSFIWVRQHKAPWEGYQLDRATMLFMMIFIFGMATLGIVSFLLEVFFKIDLGTNLANTAHVVGILMGALLGFLPFFRRRYA